MKNSPGYVIIENALIDLVKPTPILISPEKSKQQLFQYLKQPMFLHFPGQDLLQQMKIVPQKQTKELC